MGLFRRKDDTIDLTATSEDSPADDDGPEAAAASTAPLHAGVPGRCPTCDGFGYIDNIDMVHKYQRQHCRTCGHVWEFTFDDAGDVLDLTDIETGSLEREDFGIQF